MRVITGKFRGKRLLSPEGNAVRPTTDRVKETMFNILASKGYASDITVLDLFAGSGALGIEALSRGANECVFVDRDRRSAELVKKNLKVIGVNSEVYNTDYSIALPRLKGRKFDLVILDPPYDSNVEKKVCDMLVEYDLLYDDSIIMIEHATVNLLGGVEEKFDLQSRKCGATMLTFASPKI